MISQQLRQPIAWFLLQHSTLIALKIGNDHFFCSFHLQQRIPKTLGMTVTPRIVSFNAFEIIVTNFLKFIFISHF